MFIQVYKSTIKNLIRSGLFWLMVLILGSISVYFTARGFTTSTFVHPITGAAKYVQDSLPHFTLTYSNYIKIIYNTVYRLLLYGLPVTTIVSTVLIINHDYGDNFYEIEKSSNISPFSYLLGRITALITVNFSLCIIASFFSLHAYIYTRGGLSMMGTTYYFVDSSIRLLRIIVCLAFPTVLFYIGFTYLLGCIFRYGLYASIISVGYVMIAIMPPSLANKFLPFVYTDYLSSSPDYLCKYLMWYGTYAFSPFSYLKNDAILAFLFQPTVFLLTVFTSYFFIRKRDK